MSDIAEKILACRMVSNDAEAEDIRQYLYFLLTTLWIEEESFSGKRPFGNSGWQNDVYYSLVKEGILPGVWHEDEYYASGYDKCQADDMIIEAMMELCGYQPKEDDES